MWLYWPRRITNMNLSHREESIYNMTLFMYVVHDTKQLAFDDQNASLSFHLTIKSHLIPHTTFLYLISS
jgi:hypothetical protein